MKKLSLFLVFFFTISTYAGEFTVIKVSDGDTIRVAGYDLVLNVRFAGIDAPETAKRRGKKPGQPFSLRAKKYVIKRVLGKKVNLIGHGGPGPFNRPICEVFIDGKSLNLELVEFGLAEVYRGKPPKGFDISPYLEAQKKAKAAKTGMWIQGDKYISPKNWRKMNKKKRK